MFRHYCNTTAVGYVVGACACFTRYILYLQPMTGGLFLFFFLSVVFVVYLAPSTPKIRGGRKAVCDGLSIGRPSDGVYSDARQRFSNPLPDYVLYAPRTVCHADHNYRVLGVAVSRNAGRAGYFFLFFFSSSGVFLVRFYQTFTSEISRAVRAGAGGQTRTQSDKSSRALSRSPFTILPCTQHTHTCLHWACI